MKLGTKIMIVAVVPLIIFLITSFVLIKGYWGTYKESQETLYNVNALEVIVRVIDELQIEREMSVNYMTEKVALEKEKDDKKKSELASKAKVIKEKLDEQKNSYVNPEIEEFKKLLPNATLTDETRQKMMENLALLTEVRDLNKSQDRSDIFLKYTGLIRGFMNFYSAAASLTDISRISTKIKSVHILENAKENAAKLRGSLVNILMINKAIVESELSLLLNVKASIDSNLHSPVLVIRPEGYETIAGFAKDPRWSKANEIFQVVLRNADFGLYNEDPEEFRKTATAMLNDIANLAATEFADLKILLDNTSGEAQKALLLIASVNVIAIVLLLTYTFMAIRSITKPLNKVIEDLLGFTDEVNNYVRDLDDSSETLTSAAESTTNSVQQVGASTDEISAMLKSTFESSNQALANVQEGQNDSEVGTQVIGELQQAMKDIQEANNDLKELENVISEIGAKTSVINDIVFETRLLSFNASIEAARAGQHGKGFAVVAEEVGNLAKMSGDAADTIANLIKQSTEKVNQTIGKTSSRINISQEISDKCTEVFAKISTNIDQLAVQINTITSSAKEQEIGIKEVGKAMKEMDEIALKNTESAQETKNISISLKERVVDLTNSVDELEEISTGK